MDHQRDQQKIQLLQNNIENYERLSRSTSIEILPHEIKDVFRIKSRDPAARTVVVDFTGILTKEKIIRTYRTANKDGNRLTTDKLKLSGPSKPIFIYENLSAKMKRLLYLSQDFAKSNDYSHCWISNSKILLRRKEGEHLKNYKR